MHNIPSIYKAQKGTECSECGIKRHQAVAVQL